MKHEGDHSSHPQLEQLLDYLEGRLGPADVLVVEEHLASDCLRCHADLGWLREMLALMAADVWLDPPARLSAAARQLFLQQDEPETEAFSFGEWLRSVFAPPQRLAVGFAVIIAMIAVGAVVFQLLSQQVIMQEAQPVEISGTVLVQQAGSDEWRAVGEDAIFSSGDSIRTGDDSLIVLAVSDVSLTRVEENTELDIVQMASRSDGSETVVVLKQNVGQTQNMVNRLPSADSRFEIQTPSASVVVRGTAFTVEVSNSGATRVAVAEGVVDVMAQGMTVALEAGQATTVQPGEVPAAAVSVPTPTILVTMPPTPGVGEEEPTSTRVETRPPPTATQIATSSPGTTLGTGTATPTVPATVTPTPTQRPTQPPPTQPPPTQPPPTQPPTQPPPTQPPPTQPPPTQPPSPTPPPPTATPEDTKTPPGQTKTPQPPGQTRTPEPNNGKKS